jgi:hypothetical protein
MEASDQHALYNYTKRIGELTLGREPDSKSRLASNVFVKIAYRQDANIPLFPSLHCLRIVDTSSSLDFLDVLLSPALTTLELTAIPVDDPHYPSVLSFLESAVDEASNLSTLILGPGRIQDQIIDISLRYKNLRRFELRNTGISITKQLLQDIGSLQHLETFVLRDPFSEPTIFPVMDEAAMEPKPPYILERGSSLEPEVVPQHFGWGFGQPKTFSQPDSVEWGIGPSPELEPTVSHVMNELAMEPQPPVCFGPSRSPSPKPTSLHEPTEAIVDSSLFQALRTLDVGSSSSSLIEDLVAKVSPSNLQELSIDFTRLLEADVSGHGTNGVP